MKIMFIALCLLFVAFTQKPPMWPVRFQIGFVQSWASTKTQDFGKLWYDSEKVMSRLDRNNGKYDPFCNTVVDGSLACIQLVREKKRYVIFPTIKLCCFCCDSDHGCGILRRDWLQSTKFVGIDELSQKFYNKFVDEKEGIQYWASTDERQIPRKLVEQKSVFKDFITNEYSEQVILSSVFALPSYCNGTACPANSECGKFREEKK